MLGLEVLIAVTKGLQIGHLTIDCIAAKSSLER